MTSDSTITLFRTKLLFFTNFLRQYDVYLDNKKVTSFRIADTDTCYFYIIEGIIRNNSREIYIYTPGTYHSTVYDNNYSPGKKYILMTKNE